MRLCAEAHRRTFFLWLAPFGTCSWSRSTHFLALLAHCPRWWVARPGRPSGRARQTSPLHWPPPACQQTAAFLHPSDNAPRQNGCGMTVCSSICREAKCGSRLDHGRDRRREQLPTHRCCRSGRFSSVTLPSRPDRKEGDGGVSEMPPWRSDGDARRNSAGG